MDFSLNEEQKSIVNMLEKFSKQELLPEYMKWDREAKFPYSQWAKIAELELPGLITPEEYGGQGADYVTAGLAIEEISKGDINMAYVLIGQFLVSEILLSCASEEIKKEWLPKISKGEKIMGLAITEPHCGTDAAALKTRAVRSGGKYILNGEKSGISYCTNAHAEIIFAKTDPDSGSRGVSAFLVPTDLPGISCHAHQDMGNRSLQRGSIFLENVEVPVGNLIGGEGQGFREVMKGFDLSRILFSFACLGAATTTLDETVQYVKERHAFGRPLAKFEGVSFPVTEHYSRLEAVRWLSYLALWKRDQRLPHSKEGNMSKWLAAEYAVQAIHDCVILHGHYGLTQEFPLEQRLRDVMSIEVADGTANAIKIVLTREIFGREFLPY